MQARSRRLLLLGVLLSVSTLTASAQQLLYTNKATSNPFDTQTAVLRERGKKGLDYNFKYQEGEDVDSALAFPLDLSTAVVTLTIGATPPLQCSPGTVPPAGACRFSPVAGDDDADIDTVRVYFNGDFPASTNVQLSITGAKSTPIPAAPQDNANATITFTTGANAPRPPANIELVFDVSGSMAQAAVPGDSVTRMQALKDAVQAYFLMLNDYGAIGDKTGVVYFASNATAFPSGPNNLRDVLDVPQITAIRNDINAQVPTTMTAMGAGLLLANTNGFVPEGGSGSKNVILFSDGEQNITPLIEVVEGQLRVGGTPYVAARVCPVTAGTNTAPGFALQQQIADARCDSGHARINEGSTFGPGELTTFFIETLSAIVIGDKVEPVVNVTGTVRTTQEVSHTFVAGENDIALSVLLSWDAPDETALAGVDTLPFRLIAPDGTVVATKHLTQQARNMTFTTLHLPVHKGKTKVAVKGKWTVELQPKLMQSKQHDYHLMVMLDSPTIATEYAVTTKDAGTGEPLVLQATLRDGGAPLKNAKVFAEVLAPNEGVGDLLSRLKVRAAPQSADSSSDAVRKLLTAARGRETSRFFGTVRRPRVVLADDGLGKDAKANDGIYTGVFTGANEEGHYHFRFHARGNSGHGEFERVRSEAVFVRPKPDGARTLLQLVSSRATDRGTVANLRLVPRDRLGNHLGPDYGKRGRLQLTVDVSEGEVLSFPVDRLDGSYTVSVLVPRGSDPRVTVRMGKDVVKTVSMRELK